MKVCVVARWEEPAGWIDSLDGWLPFVVQKGVQMPNVGREASSFFWALARLRDHLRPSDQLAFLQGDPHAHGFNTSMLADKAAGFRWLGDDIYACDGQGDPHHHGLDVAGGYEMLTGRPFPGEIRFLPGAQFRVTGRDTRRYTASTYRRLQQWACEGENAWVMERLWQVLFDRPG